MDIFAFILVIVLIRMRPCVAFSQCLRGCSCVEDRYGRSLTCMEDSLFRSIPEELPEGLTKARIEKSHFSEIPRGAFSRSTALENLWLNFNEIALINSKGLEGLSNLTELRLQGNKLRSLPWTAFEDTPALKILDLKKNQLDVLPENALKYLHGLTYLDLSFNQLTVISKEVFLNWPLYQKLRSQEGAEGGDVGPNVVLALHDNPWLCDCRLKGFVEFTRSLSPPIILMNSYLSCAGPDFKAGQFFHEVEVRTCVKPVVSPATANMSLALGGNATLSCLAKARPQPSVWWTYGLKIIRGFHEFQERVDEDTVRSLLLIPSLQVSDRGIYTCTAVNYMGNSSATILVDIQTPEGSTAHSTNKETAAQPSSAQENIFIDIRIAKQTVRGISIEWYAALEHPDQTWFTIHFGRIETKKETIFIGPGINSYTVNDLLPATKYEICVTLKNESPRPGQCIVFVTGSDITEMEQREKLIHIVVIVLAMVLAVPIGMYACTTDTKLACVERILILWKNRRESRSQGAERERQGTFDSLQAASDEGLVNKDSSEDRKVRRRSEDRSIKGRLSAQLY